jgi:hypothetical protein
VTRAELRLRMDRTIAGGVAVALHRVLADWGEAGSNAAAEEGTGAPAQPGDATWERRVFDSDAWTTPGGDFAAASATQTVAAAGGYAWSSPQLAADVQRWLDEPASNFGWIVIADESRSPTAKRFVSREGNPSTARPALIVEFEVGGSGATATPTATAPAASPTPVPDTATATPTTRTPPASATATAERTVSTPAASPTATPVPTGAAPCIGDCDDDGAVSINELIVGVNIALGNAGIETCAAFDADDSLAVSINELVAAVRNAGRGCG